MADRINAAEMQEFLDQNPDVTGIDMLIPDANGVMRGKRIGVESAMKLVTEGVRMPFSTYFLDTTGQNCETLPYGTNDGDPDLPVFGVSGTISQVPWATLNTAQIIGTMEEDDGRPFFGDPRNVLRKALEPLSKMGLTPVVAVELEFYLLDTEMTPDGYAQVAQSGITTRRQTMTQCYGMDELYEFEGFIADIARTCRSQNIPADTAVKEYGAGQYEINLHHVGDPLKACDDAMMLKRAIKAVARNHGMVASFMAKPFAETAGCGLHIHVSLVDEDGNNYFAGPTDPETGVPMAATLRHAIGGLQEAMAESMAIFAPNANSYRRLQAGSYAPINTAWGSNNRTVSLRIPHCDERSVRVEHRVAGADANPYLVMAAVLAGIHHGLENEIDPGKPIEGNAYEQIKNDLPVHWHRAINFFRDGKILKPYLGEKFSDAFEGIRRFESAEFNKRIQPLDYEWYMRTV
ncbi:glutamine synthetase family protein [Aestuariispira insulae]|uniref:Glutamate--putrescine ligase n=1 Tax=Aestuariispira insulae TaxID=1461337 RepID=A0A3D9HKC5_9PROT|nr:glutamine synthetase family protein [Aestuariispira insulae]RED49923.1 glutamate--putrescine ligase [Aestuariispira insulae]